MGRNDVAINLWLRHVGAHHANDICLFRGFFHAQGGPTFGLGLCPAFSTFAKTNNDVDSAISKVHRLSTTLAAVTNHGDAKVFKGLRIDIRLKKHCGHCGLQLFPKIPEGIDVWLNQKNDSQDVRAAQVVLHEICSTLFIGVKFAIEEMDFRLI
jgi:hypothetical protein